MEHKNIKFIADKIKENMSKVIVGNDEVISLLITCLFSEGNVLLEDVPGTGKTMMAKSLAKSIDASFKRISFTPDLLPSDITGISYYNQKKGEFVFREGPAFTNILLADEINRATAKTQASLLECMEEKQISVDSVTRKLDSPFFVIATQNPVETIGTFPLPEAELDRFMMKISVGFPSPSEELTIMDRFSESYTNPLDELPSVCSTNDLCEIQRLTYNVFIHEDIKKYIINIINATRNHPDIILGVSPRGTIAFVRALKTFAAINGRDYVVPDDVKKLATHVLSHRLVIGSSFGITSNATSYIEAILSQTPAPTENFQK